LQVCIVRVRFVRAPKLGPDFALVAETFARRQLGDSLDDVRRLVARHLIVPRREAEHFLRSLILVSQRILVN
jgi:hypothetical protein